MRQLLEVSFSYLVMFGIVFRMFRLFSSSCHQLITTELHFTNKSWLEPTWLGYCCLREFEKIIISLPSEIDRHGPNCRQSHLFTAFPSSNSFFILGVLLLIEKRAHVQIFVPKTQHIWADINFHLNESQNALLNNKVPIAPPSNSYWSSSIAKVNHAIATSAHRRGSTEGSKQPSSLSFPKEAELMRALTVPIAFFHKGPWEFVVFIIGLSAPQLTIYTPLPLTHTPPLW